jgi:hypothetical protein
MNISFFVFCMAAFVVTVAIDTYTKTHHQGRKS